LRNTKALYVILQIDCVAMKYLFTLLFYVGRSWTFFLFVVTMVARSYRITCWLWLILPHLTGAFIISNPGFCHPRVIHCCFSLTSLTLKWIPVALCRNRKNSYSSKKWRRFRKTTVGRCLGVIMAILGFWIIIETGGFQTWVANPRGVVNHFWEVASRYFVYSCITFALFQC